jgi:hypothetical protein
MPAEFEGLLEYLIRRVPTATAGALRNVAGDSFLPIGEVLPETFPSLTPDGCDERLLALRGIRLRRGQQAFREALIGRYGGRCLISGCDFLGVLEAAHIRPYRGPGDNHPGNGLLLRSDLHVLFDLDMIGVDPSTMQIVVQPALLRSEYGLLDGRKLLLSNDAGPDSSALRTRWKAFRRE